MLIIRLFVRLTRSLKLTDKSNEDNLQLILGIMKKIGLNAVNYLDNEQDSPAESWEMYLVYMYINPGFFDKRDS